MASPRFYYITMSAAAGVVLIPGTHGFRYGCILPIGPSDVGGGELCASAARSQMNHVLLKNEKQKQQKQKKTKKKREKRKTKTKKKRRSERKCKNDGDDD